MFASFHSKGTIPSCSDMLNTCASGILICSTISFSILGDIPSTPGDLFSFILLILLATTSGVTYHVYSVCRPIHCKKLLVPQKYPQDFQPVNKPVRHSSAHNASRDLQPLATVAATKQVIENGGTQYRS